MLPSEGKSRGWEEIGIFKSGKERKEKNFKGMKTEGNENASNNIIMPLVIIPLVFIIPLVNISYLRRVYGVNCDKRLGIHLSRPLPLVILMMALSLLLLTKGCHQNILGKYY